jgi:hypothetical protein
MKRRILPLLILSLVFSGLHAKADSITYTETTIGTGTFAGAAFSNATVTLTGTGNTAGISNSGGVFILILPVSVQISGIGTFGFTDAIQVVDNQPGFLAGFGDNTQNLAILFDSADPFSSYNLASSIGPTSGSSLFNPGRSFATAGGAFVLTSASNPTFSASPAPEPSSFALLSTGLVGLAGLVRRMRTQSQSHPV